MSEERQITATGPNRILTNTGVWSPDSRWIVCDVRSDEAGAVFDGSCIETVEVDTGESRTIHRTGDGAHCGVVTCHPREFRVVFIQGPENPTPDWQYGPAHRQGMVVDFAKPAHAVPLDARDLVPPFTPGALRGGSHVHVWDAAGEWVSFTYNDALVETDIRDVGVSVPGRPVSVPKRHPRNHDGNYFSVVASRTTANPVPGSDDIVRACEEGWVGSDGYTRRDGSRQRRALAFQGHVVTRTGKTIPEVFIVDVPENVSIQGEGPLAGDEHHRPCPPRGAIQRRLTVTEGRKFPGLSGPRHWLRCSPDGSRIAFLMKDDDGVVQLWTVPPIGGEPEQVTQNAWSVSSAFSWSPDGRFVAHAMDKSICVTDMAAGRTERLTPRSDDTLAPRPEACVFSPDGMRIAYMRRIPSADGARNQVFVVNLGM